MQKAMIPGHSRKKRVLRVLPGVAKNWFAKILLQPSMKSVVTSNETPIIGASQKSVAAGLCMPMFLLRISSCVRLHRRPPRALAEVTSRKPLRTKWVSVATMRSTPAQMRNITPMSRHENFSSRRRNAKRRTKTRDDDLHIADRTTV